MINQAKEERYLLLGLNGSALSKSTNFLPENKSNPKN
jgi:hypothetical protein